MMANTAAAFNDSLAALCIIMIAINLAAAPPACYLPKWVGIPQAACAKRGNKARTKNRHMTAAAQRQSQRIRPGARFALATKNICPIITDRQVFGGGAEVSGFTGHRLAPVFWMGS